MPVKKFRTPKRVRRKRRTKHPRRTNRKTTKNKKLTSRNRGGRTYQGGVFDIGIDFSKVCGFAMLFPVRGSDDMIYYPIYIAQMDGGEKEVIGPIYIGFNSFKDIISLMITEFKKAEKSSNFETKESAKSSHENVLFYLHLSNSLELEKTKKAKKSDVLERYTFFNHLIHDLCNSCKSLCRSGETNPGLMLSSFLKELDTPSTVEEEFEYSDLDEIKKSVGGMASVRVLNFYKRCFDQHVLPLPGSKFVYEMEESSKLNHTPNLDEYGILKPEDHKRCLHEFHIARETAIQNLQMEIASLFSKIEKINSLKPSEENSSVGGGKKGGMQGRMSAQKKKAFDPRVEIIKQKSITRKFLQDKKRMSKEQIKIIQKHFQDSGIDFNEENVEKYLRLNLTVKDLEEIRAEAHVPGSVEKITSILQRAEAQRSSQRVRKDALEFLENKGMDKRQIEIIQNQVEKNGMVFNKENVEEYLSKLIKEDLEELKKKAQAMDSIEKIKRERAQERAQEDVLEFLQDKGMNERQINLIRTRFEDSGMDLNKENLEEVLRTWFSEEDFEKVFGMQLESIYMKNESPKKADNLSDWTRDYGGKHEKLSKQLAKRKKELESVTFHDFLQILPPVTLRPIRKPDSLEEGDAKGPIALMKSLPLDTPEVSKVNDGGSSVATKDLPRKHIFEVVDRKFKIDDDEYMPVKNEKGIWELKKFKMMENSGLIHYVDSSSPPSTPANSPISPVGQLEGFFTCDKDMKVKEGASGVFAKFVGMRFIYHDTGRVLTLKEYKDEKKMSGRKEIIDEITEEWYLGRVREVLTERPSKKWGFLPDHQLEAQSFDKRVSVLETCLERLENGEPNDLGFAFRKSQEVREILSACGFTFEGIEEHLLDSEKLTSKLTSLKKDLEAQEKGKYEEKYFITGVKSLVTNGTSGIIHCIFPGYLEISEVLEVFALMDKFLRDIHPTLEDPNSQPPLAPITGDRLFPNNYPIVVYTVFSKAQTSLEQLRDNGDPENTIGTDARANTKPSQVLLQLDSFRSKISDESVQAADMSIRYFIDLLSGLLGGEKKADIMHAIYSLVVFSQKILEKQGMPPNSEEAKYQDYIGPEWIAKRISDMILGGLVASAPHQQRLLKMYGNDFSVVTLEKYIPIFLHMIYYLGSSSVDLPQEAGDYAISKHKFFHKNVVISAREKDFSLAFRKMVTEKINSMKDSNGFPLSDSIKEELKTKLYTQEYLNLKSTSLDQARNLINKKLEELLEEEEAKSTPAPSPDAVGVTATARGEPAQSLVAVAPSPDAVGVTATAREEPAQSLVAVAPSPDDTATPPLPEGVPQEPPPTQVVEWSVDPNKDGLYLKKDEAGLHWRIVMTPAKDGPENFNVVIHSTAAEKLKMDSNLTLIHGKLKHSWNRLVSLGYKCIKFYYVSGENVIPVEIPPNHQKKQIEDLSRYLKGELPEEYFEERGGNKHIHIYEFSKGEPEGGATNKRINRTKRTNNKRNNRSKRKKMNRMNNKHIKRSNRTNRKRTNRKRTKRSKRSNKRNRSNRRR